MSLVKECFKSLKYDLELIDKYKLSSETGHLVTSRVLNIINKLLKEVSYFEKRNTEIPIDLESIQFDLEGDGEIKFKLRYNEDCLILNELRGKKFKIVYLED